MNDKLEKIQPPGALAVPDHLRDVHNHFGGENVTKEDLILPRLALCQSTNDELKKSKEKYIERLEAGQFFNSVTREIYGEEVHVIPLQFAKSRIYYKPPVGSGVILCRSNNGINGGTIAPVCAQCPHSQFSADGTPPACTDYANFPVLLLPTMQLMVMSLKSTALTAARNWVTRMQNLNKPYFSSVYSIRALETPKPKGTIFSPVISRAKNGTIDGVVNGWGTADQYEFANAAYHELKGRKIAVDAEEAIDAETETTGRDGAIDDSSIPF